MTPPYPRRTRRRWLTRDAAITLIVWLSVVSVSLLLVTTCVLSSGCGAAQGKMYWSPAALPATPAATRSVFSPHSTPDMR